MIFEPKLAYILIFLLNMTD